MISKKTTKNMEFAKIDNNDKDYYDKISGKSLTCDKGDGNLYFGKFLSKGSEGLYDL